MEHSLNRKNSTNETILNPSTNVEITDSQQTFDSSMLTFLGNGTLSTTQAITLTPDQLVNRVIGCIISADANVSITVNLPSAAQLRAANAPSTFLTPISLWTSRASGTGSVSFSLAFSNAGNQSIQQVTFGSPSVNTGTSVSVSASNTSQTQTRRWLFWRASNGGNNYTFLLV